MSHLNISEVEFEPFLKEAVRNYLTQEHNIYVPLETIGLIWTCDDGNYSVQLESKNEAETE